MLHQLTGFIDDDLCQSFTTYALRERLHNFKSYGKEMPDTHGVYKDKFAQACLFFPQGRVQKYFKDDIHPSYAYYIVYEHGHRLTKHVDKNACEITLTIHTGHLYGDSYKGSTWPIFFDDTPIPLNVGDALMYEQKTHKPVHWRKPFEGIYQVQLLLHYVSGDKDKIPYPVKDLIETA